MKPERFLVCAFSAMFVGAMVGSVSGQGTSVGNRRDGQHLFERETFGGNGRTCRTCHSEATGTVSPADAQLRFQQNPGDPLFLHDGRDEVGNGVTRILADATILMTIPLPPNVRLADDPAATSVVLRRGIPTTLNTPALDPVLMVDGRQPTLEAQAAGAIHDHAQGTVFPTGQDLERLKQFQLTDAFFTSPVLRDLARHKGPAPSLPLGNTASEKRGRRFFEDIPPDFSNLPEGLKDGLCSACHSGPLLNTANEFLQLVVPGALPGLRFQDVFVSFFNKLDNPVREFVFTNPDGSHESVFSPDPGRALVTGVPPSQDTLFEHVNAFKISPLRGLTKTAPYFHDNSARTLEEVAAHYTRFFDFITGGFLQLTPQDEADIVAFLKLL
jgi:cytochrome c peroxidase